MDHTRDPCPWVILNDFGGAFCMGVCLLEPIVDIHFDTSACEARRRRASPLQKFDSANMTFRTRLLEGRSGTALKDSGTVHTANGG